MIKALLPAAALALAGAAQAQSDGGRALLDRVCAKCHTLQATLEQHNTRDRWSEIVDSMVARGAEGSDADLEKIVDYLARTQGPRISINQATEAQIAATLELPRETAAAIVAWRQKNGRFQSLGDLKKVPGVDAADLDRKQARIAFD